VIVISVPPDCGPVVGETSVTLGPGTYVNAPVKAAVWPSVLTTTRFAQPVPAGAVHRISVGPDDSTVHSFPARDTVAGSRWVPVIVISVPPDGGPLVGEMAVMVGTGM
jgi:hypothetical protein